MSKGSRLVFSSAATDASFLTLASLYRFFAIVQTELGDTFKVTLDFGADGVKGMRMQLIDTLPVASSMNVTKMGLLFLAAEMGDHALYVDSCCRALPPLPSPVLLQVPAGAVHHRAGGGGGDDVRVRRRGADLRAQHHVEQHAYHRHAA
jgi:hypothetical protein